jgi:hypothetical protein
MDAHDYVVKVWDAVKGGATLIIYMVILSYLMRFRNSVLKPVSVSFPLILSSLGTNVVPVSSVQC